MNISEMKISDLIPYDRNQRKNNKVVDAIAASIQEFVFRYGHESQKKKKLGEILGGQREYIYWRKIARFYFFHREIEGSEFSTCL